MGGLTALAWRSLRARQVRSILTIVGIALGVGVLYAALSTSAAIDLAIGRSVDGTIGRAGLRVATFTEHGLSAETLRVIEETPGVSVVAPALERRTYLGPDLIGPAGVPAAVTVVGVDPAAETALHDLTLREGTTLGDPAAPDALITARLAAEDGLGLGSEVVVQGLGLGRYTVVGILAGDGPAVDPSGRAIVVPLATLRPVFEGDGLTRIDVGLDPGTSLETVISELEARLTAEPYVLATPADLAAALRASTADFAAMTALIAAVSLFGAAFLIFNTLSMSVIERAREVGLLRAAGATRRQVSDFFLVQGLVLGVLGSLLGIAFGAVLAAGMARHVGSVGTVALAGADPTPSVVLTALAVGLVVTIAAALEPARRAGRIPPIEALRSRLDLPDARRARVRSLVGVLGVVALGGLLLWPNGPGGGVVRALAVYGVLLGVTLLSPVILPPLARIAGVPFALLLGFEERLARASFTRDRSRAALTVGALTVGLTMIVALGGLAQNARRAATVWLTDVVPGELVLGSIRPIDPEEGIDDLLSGLPGVERVSPIGTFALATGGIRADAAAVSGLDLSEDGRLRFTAGDRTAALTALDAGGAAVLPSSVAGRLDLGLDDILTVATSSGGTLELRVAGIVERSIPGSTSEAILVGWLDATNSLGVAGADAFAVRFTRDATPAERSSLADEGRAFALEPTPTDRIDGAIGAGLSRVFGLFDALALVAVLVAALGIVNTLTMNVLERVREIGILRAAGMSRRQVWRMVVVEAGIVGLVGAILGTAGGVLSGLVMIVLAGGGIELGHVVPWAAVGLVFVLGVTLAMLAAAYPARVASRISIIRAVRSE
jgi:putative ABC transport system permease protein